LAIAAGGRDAASAGELGEGAPQVSLFSGLVGNDAMQAAFKKVSAGGAAGLRFGGAPRAERVVMAGPGGRGRVEVAVSEPAQPADGGGDDAKGKGVVGAARAVAKGLMRGVGEPPLALQCCVMSVCLVRLFLVVLCERADACCWARSRGMRWPGMCCSSRLPL
jgi:hypothetical protein